MQVWTVPWDSGSAGRRPPTARQRPWNTRSLVKCSLLRHAALPSTLQALPNVSKGAEHPQVPGTSPKGPRRQGHFLTHQSSWETLNPARVGEQSFLHSLIYLGSVI